MRLPHLFPNLLGEAEKSGGEKPSIVEVKSIHPSFPLGRICLSPYLLVKEGGKV